jgi:hypothetical protein
VPSELTFPRTGCERLITQLPAFGIEKRDDAADALFYLILELARELRGRR